MNDLNTINLNSHKENCSRDANQVQYIIGNVALALINLNTTTG